jgi:hypothetical protein
MTAPVSIERIASKIYLIRDTKVMLDRDLAELYEVETRVLNQAVKRNIKRFPKDFMFQLTKDEFKILKSQIVTSRWGGVRKLPLAFTEQGTAICACPVQFMPMRSGVYPVKPARFLFNRDVFHWGNLRLIGLGYTLKEKQKAYGKKAKRKSALKN